MVLPIRAEQLEALRASPGQAFAAELERFVRAQIVPAQPSLARADLAALVERGIEAAVRHGLERGWDVCRFVACLCVLGEGFTADPAHPWPRQVLARKDLSATQKMDQIERHYLRRRLRLGRASARTGR